MQTVQNFDDEHGIHAVSTAHTRSSLVKSPVYLITFLVDNTARFHPLSQIWL